MAPNSRYSPARRFAPLLAALPIAMLCFVAGGSAATTGSADLAITKTANASAVTVGENLGYTIKVENLGTETATGVTVTDPLPSNTKYVSATTTAGNCALQGQKVTCAVGTLETGATAKVTSATITLTLTPQSAGTLVNTATVGGDQGDPNAANNSASASVTVNEATKPPHPTKPPKTTAAYCRGVKATIVGTPGNDTIQDTSGPDVIAALGGDDRILASAGRDLICAGAGNDYVAAGSAADRVFGGAGKDRLLGQGGPDLLKGQAGNDVLKGGWGSDRLRGGRGFDICRGGPGANSIRGCER